MKFIGNLFLFAAVFGAAALFGGVSDYEDAAEKGDSKAQYNLGVCYFKGDGVKQDFGKAVEWFKKSSEQGYGHAQCFLALCYTFGKGVKQDHAEALRLFREAAKKDIAEAQFNLGNFYETGKGGVTADVEKAKEWYLKAAAKEHGRAKEAYTKLMQPKENEQSKENRFL